MARAQFNVHVIPYRLGAGGYEFALFRRINGYPMQKRKRCCAGIIQKSICGNYMSG